jgi:hypothetical protein
MNMSQSRGANPRVRAALGTMFAIFVLQFAGCESIFGPKTDESTDDTTDEARIVITNNYDEGSLDIFMDGAFQFTLPDGDSKKIRNVSLDEHELQAKLTATGAQVETTTIDVTGYSDYTWTIDDPPDIKITNSYGVTLSIYLDGVYKFDIQDEEDRWLIDVSFGSHYLKATKASDGSEVASTTIDVDANKDYSWAIS